MVNKGIIQKEECSNFSLIICRLSIKHITNNWNDSVLQSQKFFS